MESRMLALLAGIVLAGLIAGPASAQLACTPAVQNGLLSQFSDLSHQITSGNVRNLICSSGLTTQPNNWTGTQTFTGTLTQTFSITVAKTPASASAVCTTGQLAWDISFVYVCVGTNTWKRSAISTW